MTSEKDVKRRGEEGLGHDKERPESKMDFMVGDAFSGSGGESLMSEGEGVKGVRGGVSGAWSRVLEGVWRILGVLAPYGMACSQTDAAGLASLEQGHR